MSQSPSPENPLQSAGFRLGGVKSSTLRYDDRRSGAGGGYPSGSFLCDPTRPKIWPQHTTRVFDMMDDFVSGIWCCDQLRVITLRFHSSLCIFFSCNTAVSVRKPFKTRIS
ncbi:uncharacterized protein LOC126605488 [Malus sylvestris]|uniref:Uncharacterized protein n=1 Tax=Malus domestica TaxID=3750 RepID=A0A498HV31_MALDO|nr:uncharacterized protein LOC126605488 [Malus sylvestris]RXH74630.1 hypothetical protein DVH24_029351 [Malus domestica]